LESSTTRRYQLARPAASGAAHRGSGLSFSYSLLGRGRALRTPPPGSTSSR